MTAIDSGSSSSPDAHGHGHDHDHPAHLAHHWDNSKQQFEAGKLGMWLFLATEFLLFGGLFCAYAVYRHNQPELFQWGSQFLDTKYGAINTVILILSSMTMALSVTTIMKGLKGPTLILLGLTFLGGAGFMGIKYIEYSHKFHDNIVWGPGLYVPPQHAGEHGDEHAAAGDHAADAGHDGAMAQGGMVGDDLSLPPVYDAPERIGDLEIPRSDVAPPRRGPVGLAAGTTADLDAHEKDDHGHGKKKPDPRTDPDRPANAHVFFGIYYCMTGLHGIHVLLGMGVIAWLMLRTARGEFHSGYFTPVDLGGLYWHVVDLIWIFLFPLLYLIH